MKMLNSKAHHTLALLALDLTTGGFNEIILAAVSQLLVAILPKHGHLSSILVSYKIFHVHSTWIHAVESTKASGT